MPRRRVFAVGGGKGGVGKSFVAANLGVALARTGRDVVLLDADFGGANLHSLLGLIRPARTVNHFIEGEAATLEEIALPTQVPGLRVISGTCDVLGSADLDVDAQRRLREGLVSLDVDCLIIDVGAGTGVQTLDLFNAADVRLLVITPELTSAQNAYGFLKVALYRRLQRAIEGSPGGDRLLENLGESIFSFGSTMERVDSFLSMIHGEGLELESALRMLLREFNAKIVGNMLTRDADRNVLYALRRLIGDFLGVEVEIAATLRSSSRVRTSINAGRPVAFDAANNCDGLEFDRLARSLITQDLGPLVELRQAISSSLAGGRKVFEFGLDGVEVLEISDVCDPEQLAQLDELDDEDQPERPELLLTPTPPPPEQERGRRADGTSRDRTSRHSDYGPGRFIAELGRTSRQGERGNIHVQVRLGGHWFFGELRSISQSQATVAGIHPGFSRPGDLSALRVVTMKENDEFLLPSTVDVIFEDYDEIGGQSTLRFVEPFRARPLVSYARHKWAQPSYNVS